MPTTPAAESKSQVVWYMGDDVYGVTPTERGHYVSHSARNAQERSIHGEVVFYHISHRGVCECAGYLYRGTCRHAAIVAIAQEQAAAKAAEKKVMEVGSPEWESAMSILGFAA